MKCIALPTLNLILFPMCTCAPISNGIPSATLDFSTLFFFRIRIQDLQLQDDLQRAEMKINRLRVEIAKQAKVLEDHYYTADE